MKKILLIILAFLVAAYAFSQPIPSESIKDSVLGWMKMYNRKGAKESKKIDHRNYSAAQLSICDSFSNWMQASYLPKGGLGDALRFVSEKLSPYNQHTAGRPQSYGAWTKTYTELKRVNGKLQPFTNSHAWWQISANGVPGWAVRTISVDGRYYFILPTAETEKDDEATRNRLDISTNKNCRQYISFWLENEGFGGGTQNVLLCKDNKSPFIKITRGEYLQALESALTHYYESEKKRIYEAEQGNEKRIVFPMQSLNEKIERFKTGLKLNREKYKGRLSEIALLTTKQPGLNDLDNGRDVFTSSYLTDPDTNSGKYPVYRIDSTMAANCKKDQPQWILITWEHYNHLDRIEMQQHEAILENFNFEYVYNFFFAPEKVKGQLYKPLRAPLLRP